MKVAASERIDDAILEPLLDVECSMQVLMEKGTTTATFIKVEETKREEDIKDAILHRVTTICHANPWLTANLVRDKHVHKNVLMKFDRTPSEKAVAEVFQELNDTKVSQLCIRDSMETILKTVAASKAVVSAGSKLVGKAERVCRICLSKTKDKDVYLLTMSLSHAVADGYTYYQIFSQLSTKNEVVALNYIRKVEDAKACKTAAGELEYRWQFKPSLLVNILGRAVTGVKVRCFAHQVDTDMVAAAKTRFAPSGFISTNDLLTSAFGKATQSRITLMAINWRGRISTLSTQDAGNYEGAVLFDPESVERPNLIRQALQSTPVLRASERSLPGCCESLHCRFSMITSWVFPEFSGELELFSVSGQDTTSVLMHLPVYNPSEVIFNVAVVFRLRKDTTALMCFANNFTAQDLVDAGAPISLRPINQDGLLVD